MNEYKKYLAERIVADESPVTYRLLSRALGVHVNTAKEMLFDFHRSQNALRAGSIHATYLICGTKLAKHANNGQDVEMSNSGLESDDDSEDAPSVTVELVLEQDLIDSLKFYENVDSIHVYSLNPHPHKDLNTLSAISAQLVQRPDAFEPSDKFGAIVNHFVRRRDRKVQRPLTTTVTVSQTKPATAKPKPEAKEVARTDARPKKKPDSKQAAKPETSAEVSTKETKSATTKISGGIMQSFAKAAAKPKTKNADPTPKQDEPMLSDDGEDDSEPVVESQPSSKSSVSAKAAAAAAAAAENRKAKEQREDELRRMMDEDDDHDVANESEHDSPEEEMDDVLEEAPSVEETSKEEDKEPSEVVASSGDGRRRGRRRVTKKKQTIDDDGYLVTVQEQAWESFSEDEAPPSSKAKPTPTSPVSQGAKTKKPAAKAQGNIMSFFSKK